MIKPKILSDEKMLIALLDKNAHCNRAEAIRIAQEAQNDYDWKEMLGQFISFIFQDEGLGDNDDGELVSFNRTFSKEELMELKALQSQLEEVKWIDVS